MASKVNFTAETILNIEFSPKEKGYDPLEVDQVFDSIISDYKALNKNLEEQISANDKQKAEIEELKEEIKRKEFDLATLKNQLEALPKASGITDDNYRLLKKITAYERVLYKKGIDPKKALSDPDNC